MLQSKMILVAPFALIACGDGYVDILLTTHTGEIETWLGNGQAPWE